MKLNASQIDAALQELDSWTHSEESGDAIYKSYQFQDFAHAMIFVNRVAELAEDADHHPDITIIMRYSAVMLALSTHSADGLTKKDFDLAKAIDAWIVVQAHLRYFEAHLSATEFAAMRPEGTRLSACADIVR